MLPATFDLELYQGDDYSLVVVVHSRNSDGSVGAAVDLTGYLGTAQIRATPTAQTKIADFTVTIAANQTTDTGVVTLTLPHATTKDIPPTAQTTGPYYWDLQFVAGGLTATYVAGRVTVDAEVTR